MNSYRLVDKEIPDLFEVESRTNATCLPLKFVLKTKLEKMKKLFLLIAGIANVCTITAQENHDKVVKGMNQLLSNELKKENVHNVFMSVYAPSRDFEWHVAKGSFKNGSGVTTENPFYTASIGKTFTATAIGLLVDRGRIRFDDPISKYLLDSVMNGLHVMNGIDYSDSIRVSHLLQHTSGLPDYFSSETQDGSAAMFDLIISQPDRFWEPEELIAFSTAHFVPFFAPGTGYYYTDTEYVLLGMIIERVSGMQFHEFLSSNIFVPLNMSQTYVNLRSVAGQAKAEMAEMYAGEYEVSSFRSLSADWAGGAVVSIGKDLITFQKALMNGELLSQATWEEMQQWTDETKGMTYGYGLRKIAFKELSSILPEWEVIGHSGANGTSMYYCPDLDIYLAGTLNQLEASKEAVILMVKILMQCKEL